MLEIVPNLHPLVVHFPLALSPLAAIFLLAARLRAASSGSASSVAQWATVGHWALWLSALFAPLAAWFGWQAFGTVDHDGAGHLAMTLHRNWALSTTLALIIIAAFDRWRCRVDQPASWPTTIGAVLLFGAVTVTGWLGGEAVYRHGIGVLALPAKPDTAAAAADSIPSKVPVRVEHVHQKDGHTHQH